MARYGGKRYQKTRRVLMDVPVDVHEAFEVIGPTIGDVKSIQGEQDAAQVVNDVLKKARAESQERAQCILQQAQEQQVQKQQEQDNVKQGPEQTVKQEQQGRIAAKDESIMEQQELVVKDESLVEQLANPGNADVNKLAEKLAAANDVNKLTEKLAAVNSDPVGLSEDELSIVEQAVSFQDDDISISKE